MSSGPPKDKRKTTRPKSIDVIEEQLDLKYGDCMTDAGIKFYDDMNKCEGLYTRQPVNKDQFLKAYHAIGATLADKKEVVSKRQYRSKASRRRRRSGLKAARSRKRNRSAKKRSRTLAAKKRRRSEERARQRMRRSRNY